MSTRSTTHFNYGDKTVAIIYRHPDGYPDRAGLDIRRFFNECKTLEDSRLIDPSYLAAKYVVFLADMFNKRTEYKNGKFTEKKPESRLEFISVGVVLEDPGDIEYRYVIDCANIDANGLPDLKCYSEVEGKAVKIPPLPKETKKKSS